MVRFCDFLLFSVFLFSEGGCFEPWLSVFRTGLSSVLGWQFSGVEVLAREGQSSVLELVIKFSVRNCCDRNLEDILKDK